MLEKPSTDKVSEEFAQSCLEVAVIHTCCSISPCAKITKIPPADTFPVLHFAWFQINSKNNT